MKKIKRILYVWDYLEWGGAQIYFLGLMRETRRHYEISAVMPRGTNDKLKGYFRAENIDFAEFDGHINLQPPRGFSDKLKRRFDNALCHRRLANFLAAQNLDETALHIDVPPWSGFFLLSRLARKTHVFTTFHIALPFENNWRFRSWKKKFQLLQNLPNYHILASNLDVKESLKNYVSPEKWNEIPVAHTGINSAEIARLNAETFNAKIIRQKIEVPADKFVFLTLAQIIERKGVRVWLAAVEILRERHVAAFEKMFFAWIGEGNLREEINQILAEKNLLSAVKIIRQTKIGATREDILHAVKSCDVFVLPTFAEGLPGAMLEAMALGKPTIASEVNAVPEAVENNLSGILTKAGNAENLAEAMLELFQNQTLREKIADSGRQKVTAHFTEENAAKITLDYYKKFI